LQKVKTAAEKILNGEKKNGSIPELWDGNAAGRIVDIIFNYLTPQKYS
jgi:hypothetical protein